MALSLEQNTSTKKNTFSNATHTVARFALCSSNATLEAQLETLLEDASPLLHGLSQQHLLWQRNATRAPANALSLASCQQAAHGMAKAVVLKLSTIELLVELLEQLAAPNGIYDQVFNVTHQRRSKRHDTEYTSREHNMNSCREKIAELNDKVARLNNSSPVDRVSVKIRLCHLTKASLQAQLAASVQERTARGVGGIQQRDGQARHTSERFPLAAQFPHE